MLRSTRTRYLLALYSLVAASGCFLTFLPEPSNPSAKAPGLNAHPPASQATGIATGPSVTPARDLGPARKTTTSRASVAHRKPYEGDELAAASKEHTSAPVPAPPASGMEALSFDTPTFHIVKPGESVASISYRYLPRTIFMTAAELEAAIREANPLLARTRLHPGQEILIPGVEPQPIVERPRPLPKDAEVRAIYLTSWTAGSERGISLIRRWKAAGGNAICFDIKDFDGLISVPFDHPLAPKRGALIRNLSKFIRFMHQQDLHVIARIALFRDEHIAKTYPELAVRSRRSGDPWRENGKQVWTDPSLRAVQDYNLALALHAARAGADEIQFDYVRFPAEGDQEDAKFHFESEDGEASSIPATSPETSSEGPSWTRSRVITEFVKRAYAETRPTGALLSLDVFGVMAWGRPVDLARTGQRIGEMARYCDVLSPMIYPSHFFGMDGYERPGDAPEHFIAASMMRFSEITAESGVVIRPWLQAFGWRTPSYSTDYVVTQVRVANQHGATGYLFWNANNDYSKPFAAMPTLLALTRRRGPEKGAGKERAESGPEAASAALRVEGPPDPPADEELPENVVAFD